ncbi:hypothetical protein HanPI659440_Chr14g0562641 [Helianthus annuus]|nr:hypothetical protein HanPI659440_Chr14g0562641 [Helianthus annuus]
MKNENRSSLIIPCSFNERYTLSSSDSKIASASVRYLSSSISSQFPSYNFKRFLRTGLTTSVEIPKSAMAL